MMMMMSNFKQDVIMIIVLFQSGRIFWSKTMMMMMSNFKQDVTTMITSKHGSQLFLKKRE